jgi:hypothetical protein
MGPDLRFCRESAPADDPAAPPCTPRLHVTPPLAGSRSCPAASRRAGLGESDTKEVGMMRDPKPANEPEPDAGVLGPETGGTDELGPEDGGTDELGPEEGGTDELGPEEGGTDELGPEERGTDELGPEEGGTDVLRPPGR